MSSMLNFASRINRVLKDIPTDEEKIKVLNFVSSSYGHVVEVRPAAQVAKEQAAANAAALAANQQIEETPAEHIQ